LSRSGIVVKQVFDRERGGATAPIARLPQQKQQSTATTITATATTTTTTTACNH